MDLRITNTASIISGDRVLTDHDIIVRDGTITALEPSGSAGPGPTEGAGPNQLNGDRGRTGADGVRDGAGTDLPARDGRERVIDGSRFCAIPGFKNAHTHAAMTLLRGYGDDMRLQEWLQTRIWPAESALTGEDVYAGTRLAAIEMIASGTTFANDMYFFFPEAYRAFADSGIRAAVGLALFDFGDADRRRQIQHEVDTLLDEYAGRGSDGSLVFPTIAPHSIYTCSGELLQWAAARSREFDLPFHIHMSETEQEVDDCVAAHGLRPWRYLQRLGVLDEIAGRGIAAHGVWLDDDERSLIAEHRITLAHNPVSNMKLSSGAFDWAAVAERGIPVMLAPDGVASNNNLDMFDEMKTAALLQKHHFREPTRLPASEILAAATGGRSDLFRRWGVGGALEAGAPADITLVSLDHPQLVPVHNIESNLAYAANGTMVDTVICNGKILMEGRRIPGADEVMRAAADRAQALVKRS
ncbi:MAG: amidohydrolase [Alkalispirochaeta sp.]